MTIRLLAVLAGLLALFVFRSGQSFKNGFLSLPVLPAGYYAHRNFTTNCDRLSPDNHQFKFCEDAAFWDTLDSSRNLKDRRVVVTCDPGRKAWNTVMGPLADPAPHGSLWVYAPSGRRLLHRLTLKNYPSEHAFHPLGLDIYPSISGASSNMFVVNHASERTTIEQFTLSLSNPTVATWVRTLSSPYFISPNSIALTSPTSFYVSNDHLMTRRIPTLLSRVLPMVESVLGLPLSWVSHVSIDENGALVHTFASLGLAFANGVALSPDATQLAVASTSLGAIHFYSRSPDNTLRHTHTVPVPFNPDNIRFDDEGSLFVAGHPYLPSIMAVAANKTGVLAPSWVVSLSPRPSEHHAPPLTPPKLFDLRAPVSASERVSAVLSHDIETVFQSNGTGFSSSSTALHDSSTGALYVVGLYEQGMLVCKP